MGKIRKSSRNSRRTANSGGRHGRSPDPSQEHIEIRPNVLPHEGSASHNLGEENIRGNTLQNEFMQRAWSFFSATLGFLSQPSQSQDPISPDSTQLHSAGGVSVFRLFPNFSSQSNALSSISPALPSASSSQPSASSSHPIASSSHPIASSSHPIASSSHPIASSSHSSASSSPSSASSSPSSASSSPSSASSSPSSASSSPSSASSSHSNVQTNAATSCRSQLHTTPLSPPVSSLIRSSPLQRTPQFPPPETPQIFPHQEITPSRESLGHRPQLSPLHSTPEHFGRQKSSVNVPVTAAKQRKAAKRRKTSEPTMCVEPSPSAPTMDIDSSRARRRVRRSRARRPFERRWPRRRWRYARWIEPMTSGMVLVESWSSARRAECWLHKRWIEQSPSSNLQNHSRRRRG